MVRQQQGRFRAHGNHGRRSERQVGSALGAFGGCYLFDLFGNYQMAMRIGMGITAGVAQLLSGLPRWGGGKPVVADPA